MEPIYLTPRTTNVEMYERICANEVEPYCAQCRAKLEVLRTRGEPDGAVHLLRCPKDQKHFLKSYRVELPTWAPSKSPTSAGTEDD